MSILTKVQALLSAANTATGETDTNLTAAVQRLKDGYGGADLIKKVVSRSNVPFSVTDEDLSGITEIGNRAFYGCTGMTSITIPDSVTSIEDSAFANCTGLTSITIPSGVTSILFSTFSGCVSLTSIQLPESVTRIDRQAFIYCSGLTNITIPNGVTTIAPYIFHSCSGLTSITIPPNVTSIGECAFHSCSGLTNITIPSSVTSIGERAFNSCSGLTSIYFKGLVPPSIPYVNTFEYVPATTPIYVPFGAVDAYKAVAALIERVNYILPDPATCKTITVTATNATGAASNPAYIANDGTATLVFTASDGYELPDSVTVTGATGAWTKATGTLVLSNPTGDVGVTVVADAAGHAVNLTMLHYADEGMVYIDGDTVGISSHDVSNTIYVSHTLKITASTYSFYITNATGSITNLPYNDTRNEHTFTITQDSSCTIIYTD